MRAFSLATSVKGSALFICLGVALIAITLVRMGPTEGADHAEAPGVEGDRAADITDIYAFRSPEDTDNLVVMLNVNPLTVPADNLGSNFATDVTYQIHVDNTGDLVADATVSITFSGDPLQFTINGLGDPITGQVTPPSTDPTAPDPLITTAGGIKVFAGQRDDPFFFDLVGFNNFVAGPFVPASGLRPAGETPSDTLAGTNVSSIVIELPITALTGEATSGTGVIKAWATTSRAGSRVDRMAIPAINTVLIPSAQKDAFNQGDPVNDEANFRAMGQTTIEGLRAAVDAVLDPAVGAEDGGPLGDLTPEQVATALIPDVVTIDFSQPVQFTNGRQLTDDVIDVALQLVLNRTVGITDAIGFNDVSFLSTFPFLAPPHQPPAGELPTSGGGLPGSGSGFDWALSLMLAAGAALGLAGVGLMLVGRRAAR